MPRLLLLFLVSVCVSACWTCGLSAAPDAEPVLIQGHLAHPTRILARRAAPASDVAHAAALAASGMTVVRTSSLVQGLLVLDVEQVVAAQSAAVSGARSQAAAPALPADEVLLARIEALRASGLYAYVEPDYLVFEEAVPSDTAFTDGTLWGLRNIGQSGGLVGCDIGAEAAWDVTTGSTGVVVAVIDSGARLTHLDLASQLWRNPKEIAGNGRDDDGNGYIDDVHGINAITGSGDPSDDSGHGTHVAGTIGAAANNGQPMVGVAWQVRLMICKFLPATGEGLTSDAVESVSYATAHGAKILNCSWGSLTHSRALEDALAAARAAGVLVVASAGNDSTDNDRIPHYPSGYDLENIISVAAIDRSGYLAPFSNYGVQSVDLAAPGASIYSTLHTSDTDYGTKSGTSMAAPYVTGVAALVLAAEPTLPLAGLRDRLLQTVVQADHLTSLLASGGRVHAFRALAMAPDGQLELRISPPQDTILFAGADLLATVRVTDLIRVRGATVAAVTSTGASVVFRDDGVAPDIHADDANYMATIAVPHGVAQLSLDVTASAPGKVTAMERYTWSIQPPPANDMFANRRQITGAEAVDYVDNRSASREAGEPIHAGGAGGASVWWTWTAAGDGRVTIDTAGSSFNTLLAVYTGTSLGGLVEVAASDDVAPWDRTSRVEFSVTDGTTYQIAVDGWNGAAGSIQLQLRAAYAALNDRFDRAMPITGAPASVSGDTRNSTYDPGEPDSGGPGGSVWWAWTAPADGIGVVSISATSSYAPGIAVYVGSRVDGLVRALGRTDDREMHAKPRITFGVTAGQTYMIAATRSYYDAGGVFSMDVALLPGPVNDNFANRIAVAGDSLVITGDVSSASREAGEMGLPGPGRGSTLWWSWTPATSGTARLLTTGSTGRPTIGVFSGDTVSTLQPITADLDGMGDPNYAFLEWRVVGGTTYHIVADSYMVATHVRMTIAVLAPPANDDFANRIRITGTSATVSASNDGAGREPGEPDHLGGQTYPRPAHATLWWSWTAPADGTAIFEADGVLAVYSGSALGALTPVIDSDRGSSAESRVVTSVTGGEEYQIACDGYGYARGVVSLSVAWHEPPPNDMFAAATVLTGTSGILSGDAAWATVESGEFDPSASFVKGSVWWTWTAPIRGTVQLSTTTDQTLGVYTGNSVAALTRVLNEWYFVSSQPSAQFTAVAGQTYQFVVRPVGRGDSPVSIRFECIEAPANDMFAAPGVLTGGSGTATGSTRAATREAGEPYVGGNGRTIWWRWTAPSAGVAALSAKGSESDVIFRVFEGSSLSSLYSKADGRWLSRDGTDVPARWVARAGVTYYIAVDSYGTAGPVLLTYGITPVPANDAFAASATLVGAAFETTADNFGASAEAGELPARENGTALSSLWWRWTAPARGTLLVDVHPGDGNQNLGIFSGSALQALERLLDSHPSTSSAIVHVEAGVTYQICVDSMWATGGPFTLRGRLEAAPPNDMFADRAVLSGADVSVAVDTRFATKEPGERAHGYFRVAGSLWWSWTAPASGTTLVTTAAATGAFDVAVATGSSLPWLMPVAQGTGDSGRDVGLRFIATAGVTYHILVVGTIDPSPTLTLRVRQVQPVANDHFADRAVLTGASGHVEGDSLGAGIESGELYPGYGGTERASVWWSWTAPATGTATFRLPFEESRWWRRIRAFTGAALDTLVEQPNALPHREGVRFHAVAGTTYQIVLFDVVDGAVGGPFSFDYALEEPPGNDMFSDAARIVGASARIAGSTRLATRELGESEAASERITNSLWWRWTAPRSGMLVLELDPGEQVGHLVVATGADVRSRSTVAWGGGSDPGLVRLRTPVTAGVDYVIRVDGPEGELERFTLALDLVDPPPNDSFAGRTAITGSDVTLTGNNRGATVESGEPYIHGYQPKATLWWSWTAPASGRTVIMAGESGIPVSFGVFTGSSINSLTAVDPGIDSGSAVVFDAVAGTVYHIVVDGFGGEVGDVAMRVVMPTVPVNDLFANRTVLAGESVVAQGNNLGAMRESHEPVHAGIFRGGTLWWSWTAPRDGVVRIRTAGSTIDTLAAIYTGQAVDALQTVRFQARSELPVGERDVDLDLLVTAGTVYQIAVQGFGTTMGELVLTLEMYPRPQVRVEPSAPALVAGHAGGLAASISGDTVLSYQWSKDGVDIAGATGPTLDFISLQAFHSGAYAVRISTARETVTSDPMVVEVPAPPASDARVVNLSTRALCQTGENVLIPGFYIEGAGTKRLLMRAVGPELARFGISNPLPDPELILRRASDKVILGTNDDWGDGAAEDIRAAGRAVYAFGLTDGSKSAALLMDLPAGGYTLTASGKGDETGVSIVELYEVPGAGESTRLINISNRGHVGVGGNIMIPGFVVSEEGARTFLVRVVGPSLARFGVQGVLADPRLELYKRRPGTATDDLILTNDTWGENGDAAAIRQTTTAVHAFSLLEGSRDAAFVVTLPPGAYTVNAKGAGGTTGVAIVEVYLVP